MIFHDVTIIFSVAFASILNMKSADIRFSDKIFQLDLHREYCKGGENE